MSDLRSVACAVWAWVERIPWRCDTGRKDRGGLAVKGMQGKSSGGGGMGGSGLAEPDRDEWQGVDGWGVGAGGEPGGGAGCGRSSRWGCLSVARDRGVGG